jgi:cytochrome c oxidase subunit 2
MNTTLKQIFKLTLVAVIIMFAANLISGSVDIQGIGQEQLTAEKPWFGADEYEYKPVKAETPEQVLSGRINLAIIVFVLLMVFILANVFDIGKYTAKITGREPVNQNNANKWMMLIFFILGMIGVAWEYKVHGALILLGNSSSEHGATYDSMFTITLVLTTIVFVVTQFLLFWFSFSYAKKENHKALYYAHNNRLEVFWTIIPAIVLTLLVLRGHQTWKSIVYARDNYKGKMHHIEIFAYQFGWKARYAGADGMLGNADYKFISGKNELGLAYQPEVDSLLVELKGKIAQDEMAISQLAVSLEKLKADYKSAEGLKDYKTMESVKMEMTAIINGEKKSDLEASIKRKTKQYERIEAIKNNTERFASVFTSAAIDDIIVQEIHLAKDSLVTFDFRSRDIIHSAWLPHFRVQMNVVPGMPTKFTFRPTKTTSEAKAENGQEFDYYLYCNKICGVSHFNMKIKVVVESQAEVDAWLKTQQPVFMKKIEAVQAVEMPAAGAQDSTANPVDTTVAKPKKLALK